MKTFFPFKALNANMSHGLPISDTTTGTSAQRDGGTLLVWNAVYASAPKRKRRGARSRLRSNVEQGPARQVIHAPGLGEFLALEIVSDQPQSRISFRSFSIWLSRSVAPVAQAQDRSSSAQLERSWERGSVAVD
ncbi:hypothetical protein LA080_008495 [Diaporthe eres]|nr:hypothetical protein LA080_008495 [Diaporthe eres]